MPDASPVPILICYKIQTPDTHGSVTNIFPSSLDSSSSRPASLNIVFCLNQFCVVAASPVPPRQTAPPSVENTEIHFMPLRSSQQAPAVRLELSRF